MDQVSSTSTVACIINRRARSHAAAQMTERIEELFREQGAKPELVLVRRGQDITSIARGLVKEGRQIVVAGGGDGKPSAPLPQRWWERKSRWEFFRSEPSITSRRIWAYLWNWNQPLPTSWRARLSRSMSAT